MDGRKRREKLEQLAREREISRHPPPPPHTQVTRVASLSCQSVFEAQISTRLSHCGPLYPSFCVCVSCCRCVRGRTAQSSCWVRCAGEPLTALQCMETTTHELPHLAARPLLSIALEIFQRVFGLRAAPPRNVGISTTRHD